MKVTKVTYRRKFNLGNYETLDVELAAEINENETVDATLDALAFESLALYQKKTKKE